MWRFFIYSLIGIIFFFVPVTIQGQSTIMIDHIAMDHTNSETCFTILCIDFNIIGAIHPFLNQRWNESKTNIILVYLK